MDNYSISSLQLHQVLAESDRALAAVKDIFGDDPKVCVCVCMCACILTACS